MFSLFYHTIIFNPLYNGLIFLLSFIPNGDFGIAIIIFTLLIKLILFPLSHKSISVQRQMKILEPELQKIREKYKDDKNEQAKQIMAFYQEKDLNPFAGFLSIFIQIPILIALYQIFRGTGLPAINTALLYPFVHVPSLISMKFLGFLDVSAKNLILAIIVGITQYIQVSYSLPPPPPHKGKETTFSDELTRAMSVQSKYMLPALTFFIAWSISGGIALYLITSNLFAIAQEIYVRRKLETV